MGQRTYTVEEYLERFEPEPNTGCWLWTGNVLGGYGVVSFKKIRKTAHKLSYEFYKSEKHPLYGKPMSSETKLKISLSKTK